MVFWDAGVIYIDTLGVGVCTTTTFGPSCEIRTLFAVSRSGGRLDNFWVCCLLLFLYSLLYLYIIETTGRLMDYCSLNVLNHLGSTQYKSNMRRFLLRQHVCLILA
jgi:hypothetical protein